MSGKTSKYLRRLALVKGKVDKDKLKALKKIWMETLWNKRKLGGAV